MGSDQASYTNRPLHMPQATPLGTDRWTMDDAISDNPARTELRAGGNHTALYGSLHAVPHFLM